MQPAYVDPESGYRYYAAAQREAAEVIAILRSIDMPVRDIQRLLTDPSEANVREVLSAHRFRLEQLLNQVAGRLESIDRIVKEGTLVTRPKHTAREGFIPVHVEKVTSHMPTPERWDELRKKMPLLPSEPQEVHVVTLVSETGRTVPLWIGSFEGNALKLQVDGVKTERPLTYDLMLEAFERHGVRISRADVIGVADGTFFAELATESQSGKQILDCRPSDALNLALRAGVPVAVAQGVLDEVGVEGGSEEAY